MEQSASRIEGSVVGSDYVVQSPYPDFELPEDDIYTLITKNFPAYGSRTCLIDAATGQEISYSEFYDVMRSFALGLQSLGFSKGDTVATNSVDFPVVCLGTLAAGGVLNMSKPNLSVDGFVNQFKDSCPKFVVTIAAILPTIKEAATRSGVEKIILMGKSDYENTVPYHSLFNKPGSHFSPVSISPDDVAILSYTSGTTNTGIPKGVVLTHRSICANILQQNHPEAMCPQNGDHVIVVPPLYHSIVVTSLPTFYAGSTVVILPRFEPELFLSTIEKYSNPILPLVPPFIVFLAKDPLVEKYRLTGIKDIITGAAPIGVDVMRAASERTNCNVCQAYGLTEVGPNSHMMSRSLGMTKPGSVGPCLQNFKVRVIDLASGEALPPGKEGELWTKGPNVANGYLNNPQATKEYITEDGWFKTGDLGKINVYTHLSLFHSLFYV